jgi:hypothetical protein
MNLDKVAAYREVLDAAVDSRVEPFRRCGHFKPLKTTEEMTEERLEFDARQVGTHAEVRARTERQVVVRVAIDAK